MSSIDITKPEVPPGTAPNQKKKKLKSRVITPAGKLALSSLDKRMSVEKDIVDELLLVCGVIGTTTGNSNDELVPVTDCLNWLQDLQRALRRDEDLYRPISLLIGKWKVVEQKLLPLVLTCRYDTPMVLTIVKILVILTKPLSENTKRAGRMVIDTKKDDKDVTAQQSKMRENALEQADLLLDYKKIICHHPSHHKDQSNGLLSVFVSLLAEPLSKSGASRSDTDHLTIELVLHLFRNLLAAEPLVNSSPEMNREHNQIHHTLIYLFGKEMVLEIILVLGQELELRENAQYNLLMMELLNHLFKHQDPLVVAKSKLNDNKVQRKKATTTLLSKRLKQERSSRRDFTGNRHGHFGGTWMQESQGTGKRLYVGAANTSSSSSSTQRAALPKRKNRRNEPFVVSTTNLQIYSKRAPALDGPATHRAHKTLHEFCERFVKDCYGPVMKSLKNEFRRDSARLEDDDKVVFFRIVWFVKQWWRSSAKRTSLGQLVFTMDVFSFTLILNATDHFYQHKQFDRLAQTVALYSELLQLMHIMQTSSDETENVMVLGLMERLFYHNEPLDRLPKLLSRWSPATMTREYVCDLVEVCHMSLKLLEEVHKECLKDMEGKTNEEKNKLKDNVERIKADATEFDVKAYFVKKIVSNQVVWMYTQLLGQFKVNAPLVHHRIIALFMRISKTEIALPEVSDVDTPINPLGTKRVTLQPMLYCLPLILVLEQVLNDSTLRGDKSNVMLVQFATNLMYNFWKATEDNPLLYVECLFRHALPHRHCELVSNSYVSDELRMIAERELLLEEQRKYMDLDDAMENEREDDEEDESELVFEDDGIVGSSNRGDQTSNSSAPKRRIDDSDDDESRAKSDGEESDPVTLAKNCDGKEEEMAKHASLENTDDDEPTESVAREQSNDIHDEEPAEDKADASNLEKEPKDPETQEKISDTKEKESEKGLERGATDELQNHYKREDSNHYEQSKRELEAEDKEEQSEKRRRLEIDESSDEEAEFE